MRIPLFGRQTASEKTPPAFTWLTPAEAKARLENDHLQAIDVRETWEFAAGHVPGARNVPLRTFLRQARQELTGDSVILICAVGERASVACEMAASLGLTKVYNIRGGTNAWIASGFPVER